MPPRIEQGIHEENLRFLLNRDVYCEDYYKFVCDVVSANSQLRRAVKQNELLAEHSVRLAAHFLLNTYAHVKRRQRSTINNIIDAIEGYIESSSVACQWLLGFLASAEGLRYIRPCLLECAAKEVRTSFSCLLEKTFRFQQLHFKTTECEPVEKILGVMLTLIREDVANHIKSSAQFFALVTKFARLGPEQCNQLHKLDYFQAISKLLLGIGPDDEELASSTAVTSARQRKWAQSQSRELGELHAALATLILSCDNSAFWSEAAAAGEANEASEQNAMNIPIPTGVSAVLFDKLAPLFIREAVSACREVASTSVPAIIQALIHASYRSATFSELLMEEVMKQYNSVGSGELKNLSTLLVEVLVSLLSVPNLQFHCTVDYFALLPLIF